jgi:hypothetical protein
MSDRKMITIRLGQIESGMTLEELDALIATTKQRATAEEIFNIHIDFTYDEWMAEIYLEGERLETGEEYQQRLDNETRSRRMKEERERAEYERLRSKFEG